MTNRRRKHTFHVQLARLRIDTSIVTVEVDEFDDDLAAEAALARADTLPAAAWRPTPINPVDYKPFVQALIAKEELKSPVVDDFDIEEQIEDEAEVRYVLLRAIAYAPR